MEKELPGVPEFKGEKKPPKIDDKKTDLELAKELGITTHEAGWEEKIAQAKKRIKEEGEGEDIDVSDLN